MIIGLTGKPEAVKKKKKKNGVAIQSFSDLHIGDYVVHDNHGIGVFRGLEKISVEGVQKDYMKISYRDGGNLFVPVSQMDMIQKYIGSGGAAPRLNKLGGQDWLKAKAKARTAVKILAEDLVALYAKRAAAKGHVYGADTLWQREFEEAFPFDETDDQLNAIEDVKKDMESGKVMDRLVMRRRWLRQNGSCHPCRLQSRPGWKTGGISGAHYDPCPAALQYIL